MGIETIKAYLVCQGETVEIQGSLSPVGKKQATDAAEYLARYSIGLVSFFSSDSQGASETTRVIGSVLGGGRYPLQEGDGLSFSDRVVSAFNAAVQRASRLEGRGFAVVTDEPFITGVLDNLGEKVNGAKVAIPHGSITTLEGKRNGTLENFQFESTEVPIIE